jgi:hypothetical protein
MAKAESESWSVRFGIAVGTAAGTVVGTAAKVTRQTKEWARSAYENPLEAADEARNASVQLWNDTVAGVDRAWDQREQAPQIVRGVWRGVKDGLGGLAGHLLGRESEIKSRQETLHAQAQLYQARSVAKQRQRTRAQDDIDPLLDTTFVGGASLASYIASGAVPPDVQRAYELAYPNLAASHSLLDELRHLDAHGVVGLTSGIKGKLFELRYLDYLNADHHLPDGYHAELAHSATQPGWDIRVVGPDDHVAELIQMKATDSASYVKHALDVYPYIDVTTTSEVQSHLLMQGMAAHVADSGISNVDLTAAVNDAFDNAAVHMHWGPPVISLAIAAWSSYRREDLDVYEKSRALGARGTRSWLAYLAGGAVAVATQTWWLSIVGSMGGRIVFDSGRAKLSELDRMDGLITENRLVLDQMAV